VRIPQIGLDCWSRTLDAIDKGDAACLMEAELGPVTGQRGTPAPLLPIYDVRILHRGSCIGYGDTCI
jgi:hypothetical protein